MNAAALTILMVVALFVLLILNVPVAFALAAVGLVFIYIANGPAALYMVASTAWSGWTEFLLITIPLFVLMAAFLERSGVAEDLYEAIYRWMGPLRGGLAIGTIIICAIFAAMSGTSALGTLSMGVIAMPSMLKRNYNHRMVIGSIAAGGTMGILIPPSLGMIYYGYLSGTSVGKMFIAGIVPGILLASAFIAYIAFKCARHPEMGPPVPKSERFTWEQKFESLKSMVLPVGLILIVLGAIYSGVCTPTEAAGIGAFGAFLTVLIYRRFSWKLLKDSLMSTLRITAMVGWLTLGAKLFSQAYVALGASQIVTQVFENLGLNKWVIVIIMMIVLLILGCFMDGLGIMIITLPIFLPIIKALGFDPIWFGILYTINLEMGYLTPPFGLNLFYMRMLTPKNVAMTEIYKSALPFLGAMLLILILVMLFPNLALWLPMTM